MNYGWKRGLPSRKFPKLIAPVRVPLSPSKTLDLALFPPIWDQGDTNSCTGHGATRAIAYQRAKQGLPYLELSRLFPYWNGRMIDKAGPADEGATIGAVIQAAQQFGDCAYSDLPTDPKLAIIPPSAQAFADAVQHKALSATRIWGADSSGLEYHSKHAIDVGGIPPVFGITVYESFQSDRVGNTGIVPMPGPKEESVGGHCIVAVAYDDPSQMFTCANSWSDSWGLKGYFKIPYAYVFDPDLADDYHGITLEAA